MTPSLDELVPATLELRTFFTGCKTGDNEADNLFVSGTISIGTSCDTELLRSIE